MNARRTTEDSKSTLRPVIVASVAASLLMLVFGLGHLTLVVRLAAPVTTTRIAPNALERFPMQIGDWTGEDVSLDEAIVRRTDTDALLNRRYSRGGLTSISLFIGCGVKTRDLMPHRPDVCYPEAGWTRMDRQYVEVPLNDGRQLLCRILQFSRGTLNASKIVVLNYYLVDGEFCPDVSLLRSKVWRGSEGAGYVAQVQVIASVTENLTAGLAQRMVCDFAGESASLISGLFESTKETQESDDSSVDGNDVFGGTGSG